MVKPFKPILSETPTFATAQRNAQRVMSHLKQATLLVWVLKANDRVCCIKFNRNGSWREINA